MGRIRSVESGLDCSGERMKAGREHRVPLSGRALAIITEQKQLAFCEFAFPSPNRRSRASEALEPHQAESWESLGAPLSDMTLSAVLRRMDVTAVPTASDLLSEIGLPSRRTIREVAEMALAHSIGNKVEAAYRRGDLFDKRKQLMQDWADYASSASAAIATEATAHIADAECRSTRCEKSKLCGAAGAPSPASLLLTSQ